MYSLTCKHLHHKSRILFQMSLLPCNNRHENSFISLKAIVLAVYMAVYAYYAFKIIQVAMPVSKYTANNGNASIGLTGK